MKDIYGNELSINDTVIYESDRYYTKTGMICYVGGQSIQVIVDGMRKQFFNKNSNILPVVLIGSLIKNHSTGEVGHIETR